MSGGDYPREWFRVNRWSPAPHAREFQRETAHRLYDKTRFVQKQSAYEQWYPTREEAQAAIDAHEAQKAAMVRRKRIETAAPELLEALVEFLDGADRGMVTVATYRKARAAIAKATGAS